MKSSYLFLCLLGSYLPQLGRIRFLIIIPTLFLRTMSFDLEFPWGGLCRGKLSLGCQRCFGGEKSVIFITGLCNAGCFYCPVSLEKLSRDVVFVNEKQILNVSSIGEDISDVVEEIRLSGSTGASVTGGDPLLVPDRVFNLCHNLKVEFGTDFHIHLYTPGREGSKNIFSKLSSVVDEIRFHPRTKSDLRKLEIALEESWSVGLELPAIPGVVGSKFFQETIRTYVTKARELSRSFMYLNLNELEVSETNFRMLQKAKVLPLEHILETSTVPGSREEALKIIAYVHQNFPDLSVHYCPAAEKDSQQLPNRLLRRAYNVVKPHDLIIEEGPNRGLLIRGVIQLVPKEFLTSSLAELKALREELIEEYDLPPEMVSVDVSKGQLLTTPEFVEEFSQELHQKNPALIVGISEEYPTSDRLQTTFIPL